MKNYKKKENLEQLINQLFDPELADQVSEDIRQGFNYFEMYPAPQPETAVLNRIKADVTNALKHKQKTKAFKQLCKVVAVAAVLVFAATISLQVVTHQSNFATDIALIPASVWNNSEIAVADEELAMLTAEVELIESEIASLSSSGYSESYSALSDLEMEFIEVESNFWKG